MSGNAKQHVPLPANSVGPGSDKALFQRYVNATTWKEPIADKQWKKFNTIRPGDKIINTQFIVLDKVSTSMTKEGNTVHHIVVADNTAKMNASLFDSYGELVQPGDIIRLTGGYCQPYKGASTLYAGKLGKIERLGEFCFPFTDKSDGSDNMSKITWVQQEKDMWVPKQNGPGPVPPAAPP
mmetsp:Transcript_30713/g.63532  ORF Transcript_30713/g.63532 Transcript_30713/m.63532 type:complete len:181 (-) Transcript_30713:47-589(-)|eukprot:CAMPEP_0181326082 /NCGR_PEP_ID=MMETSP1101-20121128/21291_1 /TAXON_ID=46948 /ORGANISM="Rhodomonas abbreviata, Strain Caron Lab Isolate" /LENGTH=180 /DNA_ID=CAMNT_0023434477 /DNA_START=40 /DNA_END=582 /DNA_ORIENTATION=+